MRRLLPVLCGVVFAAGCGGGAEELGVFLDRWNQIMNQGAYEQLYDMLDSASQRSVSHDLEVMRGLDAQAQRAILGQLEQDKMTSLAPMTSARYFALLWRRATKGQTPTVDVAPASPTSADMILTYEGQSRMPLHLVVEGNRWRWQLPKQSLTPARVREPNAP